MYRKYVYSHALARSLARAQIASLARQIIVSPLN